MQRPPHLCWHEVRVVRQLLKPDQSNKNMAYELKLSEGTVKQYMHKICFRLRRSGYPEVINRTALAAWALKYFQPEEAKA